MRKFSAGNLSSILVGTESGHIFDNTSILLSFILSLSLSLFFFPFQEVELLFFIFFFSDTLHQLSLSAIPSCYSFANSYFTSILSNTVDYAHFRITRPTNIQLHRCRYTAIFINIAIYLICNICIRIIIYSEFLLCIFFLLISETYLRIVPI